MFDKYELIVQCSTNTGVVFPAILEIPSAMSEEDALKQGMTQLHERGAAFSPMAGARPIQVKVVHVTPIKISRVSLIATAHDSRLSLT
jgi:hypothetical protein